MDSKQVQLPRAAKTKAKKQKWPWIVGIIIAVVLVILVPTIVLAYAGFVPGLSSVIGTNKPVDLGVKYSQADFESFLRKSFLVIPDDATTKNLSSSNGPYVVNDKSSKSQKSGDNLIIEGTTTIGDVFSQQEITAAINSISWLSLLTKNAQVRFTDGTIEFSGNVNAQFVASIIESLSKNSSVNPILRYAKYLNNPAVYVKAQLVVMDENSNGPGTLKLQNIQIKVNKIDLPDDLAKKIMGDKPVVAHMGYAVNDYKLSHLNFTNGKLDMYGNIPSSLFYNSDISTSYLCGGNPASNLIIVNNDNGQIKSTSISCP